jgi:membrane-associated protein
MVEAFGALGAAFEQFGMLLNSVLLWMLDTVQSVDAVTRTMIAFFGMLLETSILVGLVIPGDTIVVVSSTAVASPLEYFGLIAAVVIGALSGESIGFALGRFFGPKIRASRVGQRLGERNWVRAENYLDRRGGPAVFISRFLPVLHSLIPLTVGMSAMSYRKFMTWTIPACLIWAFAYVSVGTFAGGSFRQLLSQLHFAGYIFVGGILVFIALVLVAKKLLERAEARHMDLPGDGDATTIEDPLLK